ncbi:hypothetical protein [Sphingomonas sp. LM7]|uniref:hypothetical protein n=1 Tax=Sphingomonas sp. LM7 TaxID=1938607 RepID=UPI000983E120|nr:hypothetical protein [Sphingomonas sp. LM7]AQR72618.1 hypothetical protein BXU08_02105 [Sphingomonas sp. LM7]
MQRETFAKLALGCLGICMCGSVAGMGLANYTTSGSFDFYKQRSATAWEAELPEQPTALESTDLAFASDRPDTIDDAAPKPELASFDR